MGQADWPKAKPLPELPWLKRDSIERNVEFFGRILPIVTPGGKYRKFCRLGLFEIMMRLGVHPCDMPDLYHIENALAVINIARCEWCKYWVFTYDMIDEWCEDCQDYYNDVDDD